MEPETSEVSRRPLKSRSTAWARSIAELLCNAGVAPNVISAMSMVFAVAGACCFVGVGFVDGEGWVLRLLFLGAAVGIQGRLLCNLMDGMVAVEGNRRSATGELWNEIPDRVADAVLLAGVGFAAGLPWVGGVAVIGALLTAYIRALGASLTGKQDFGGPMAKPHRMAVITVAAVGSAVFPAFAVWLLGSAIWIVVLGVVLTCGFRIQRLAAQLRRDQAI